MRAKHFHVRLWVNTSRWYVMFQLCPESRETWRTVAIFDEGNITRRTMARRAYIPKRMQFPAIWWRYDISWARRRAKLTRSTNSRTSRSVKCDRFNHNWVAIPNSGTNLSVKWEKNHLWVAGASPSILFIHRHNEIL